MTLSVCVYVCVSVCVCVLSVCKYISGNSSPIFSNFFRMLPVAVDRSSSGDVAICYVLPVLWMTSYLRKAKAAQRGRPADGSTAHLQPWTWL